MQQILSDFTHLIFSSTASKENEELHGWWVISGVLLFLVFIISILTISSL